MMKFFETVVENIFQLNNDQQNTKKKKNLKLQSKLTTKIEIEITNKILTEITSEMTIE